MSKNNNNFLCTSCLSVMCSDCKEIASEYNELLQIRTRALMERERKIEELERELAKEKRLREAFETWAKIGVPEIVIRWIDSQARKSPEGEGSGDRLRRAEGIIRGIVSLRDPRDGMVTFAPRSLLDEAEEWLKEGERDPLNKKTKGEL
jgi:hypothetical protein